MPMKAFQPADTKEKWIIDTDCGIDDAQAVFLGLHYWDVVAITCVAGNTIVDNVVKNVGKITKLC
jgi:purine nucleosidase